MARLLFLVISWFFMQALCETVGCRKPGKIPAHRTPCCPVNLTGRYPDINNLCSKDSALRIVPLLSEQFFDVINARRYHQSVSMLAEENFYTGRWVVDEQCCQDVCGEIPQLLADFYTNEITLSSKIIKSEYSEKDGSVLVNSIVMQIDGMNVQRIYFSRMLFKAEVFCDYKVHYWNLVEVICSEGGEYRYKF